MNWNYARYGKNNIEKFGEYEILIYEEHDHEERFTNVELQDRSNAFAKGLADLGVRKGDTVAVILPNGPAVPISFAGIFKAGAVFLPVIFGLTSAEIRYILDDSKAVAIITNEELYPKVKEAFQGLDTIREVIIIDSKTIPETHCFYEIISGNSVEYTMALMEADDIAVLMYTSGTTGSPKGVMLTHGNIGSNLEDGLPSWPTDSTDIYLVPLPLNHIYGMLMVNECNITGATLIIHKGFDPKLVLKSIARHKVTQFVGVPTMYIMLLQHYEPNMHNMSSIRRWISAAAPLSLETLRMVEETLGATLYEGYGMTETSPSISRQPTGTLKKPGSVGSAIRNVKIGIFDDNDQEVSTGQEGEICVKGPNVMKGYLNKPRETEAALRNGWMHTGDMGYLDDEGDLFITGRIKDLIIRGGENISPGGIEDVLFAHEAVMEAAVVGVPDPLYGEEVKAFVVLRPGHHVSEQELIDFCVKSVSRFKSPKSISFLDELPKSAVGKILKRDLRMMV